MAWPWAGALRRDSKTHAVGMSVMAAMPGFIPKASAKVSGLPSSFSRSRSKPSTVINHDRCKLVRRVPLRGRSLIPSLWPCKVEEANMFNKIDLFEILHGRC